MAMNCETFKQQIDAFIDGELSPAECQDMETHAAECASCGRMLEEAVGLSALCAGLGGEVSVPLAAQAAWRKAVRAEAKAKKRPLTIWIRGIASVAAAMVVLVAGTYGMRLSESTSASPVQSVAAFTFDQTDYGVETKRSEEGVPAGGFVLTGSGLQSDGSTATQRGAATDETSEQLEPVVLRNAARSINSDSYDSDIQWLQDLVTEYDAYFEERSETAALGDGATGRIASAVVRVPSDRLDDFLMELDQLGVTVVRSETAEDVTGLYMDTQSRLDALQLQKDKLNEMMQSAETVAELIAIDDKMTEVIASMESLEGDLRRWESQRNYSRVALTLTEVLTQSAETPTSLGARMKQGFDESVVWLNEFGQDALVMLAAALPRLAVWAPALLLVVVLILAIRARKKR